MERIAMSQQERDELEWLTVTTPEASPGRGSAFYPGHVDAVVGVPELRRVVGRGI
jgi:hypothetical protein